MFMLDFLCGDDLNYADFFCLFCSFRVSPSFATTHFIGGFAFLPFLWLVNVVWFFREAFIKPSFPGQSKIKSGKYRRGCAVSDLP